MKILRFNIHGVLASIASAIFDRPKPNHNDIIFNINIDNILL